MRIHLYDVVLFGHIALAISSFIVAAGMHLAMAQLRSARTVTQMRAPARLMHCTGSLLPLFVIALAGLGALLLHLSGGQFGWHDGWVISAAITLAMVEATGALVLGPRGKRLGLLITASQDDQISPELNRARLDPVTWLCTHAGTGAVVGIVFLMTTKPAGAIAPLVTVTAAGLGAITALPFIRPPTASYAQDQVRAFRNSRLRLVGRPDGLVTAGGALQPIEIKSHRLLQHSDRIELAFYWLLLGYLRTARAADPVGWSYLRERDGSHVREMVELPPEVLAETRDLIQAVRHARRHGVEPVWCRCTVCRGARRREVTEAVRERRDLSSVSGVGRVRREALLTAGYASWDDLLEEDAEDIARALNRPRARPLVSVSEVRRWQSHAWALTANQALLIDGAGPFPVPNEYIALDAEYTADNVWLLGVRVVRLEGDLCFCMWASPAGETQALSEINAVLDKFPGLPVVTWNGNSADLPALRKAAARADRDHLAEVFARRHIDLYLWTRQNLMLPVPGLGLKEVGEHFGITRESGVTSGLAAQMLWNRYQRTGDQEIKAELVNYNLDDLRSLAHAVECLRACAAGLPPEAGERHEVLETAVTEYEPCGPPILQLDAMLTHPRHPASRRSQKSSSPARTNHWQERLQRLRRTPR